MSQSTLIKAMAIALAMSLPGGLAMAADGKTSSSKLSSGDSNFIKEAAQGGMMEVELGKAAQDKASNEKVKEFGKRMEQDHGKANDELKKIASDKGVQLSSDLDKKHKSNVDKLTKLSGAEFDRQYMRNMVSDHKDDIKKFQNQADKGKDPDLKKFASQTLPTLKEHLQLAESASEAVKSSGKSTKSNK
jgi:putative membrane protein